jgi:hypothetical protein
MNDEFHTLMRRQRQSLAMSEEDIAAIVSMSDNEYYDLEA